ncbi:MAG: ATP synthase F1 subunit gamma [Actinomycetota bacterium]|nr:ATP synthase F1 subunit gamma [Actinomycetota bacterium]
MAKVREIKRRIKSIDSTRQITRTMEMVAGAKIRRAQARIEAARPYASKMMEILYSVAAHAGGVQHPLLEVHKPVERVLVILFTSDRGLRGAFNTNVIRKAESVIEREVQEELEEVIIPARKAWVRGKLKALFKKRTREIEKKTLGETTEEASEEKPAEGVQKEIATEGAEREETPSEETPQVEEIPEEKPGRKVDLIIIGRKGINYFKFIGREILEEYRGISDTPTIENARKLAHELMNMYAKGEVDRVYLVFNHFKSIVEQRPVEYLLLPIQKEVVGEEPTASIEEVKYIFEPKATEVLQRLLPRYVETVVYRAFLESAASEHGARRTAMKNATDNASEMIEGLIRDFNKARQAQITQEISEIVGGAEALK